MIFRKRYAITTIISILFFQSILQSCEWEQRPEINLNDLPEEVSFTNDIIPIFENSCIRCHNGTIPPDLTSENAYLEITGGGLVSPGEPQNSKFYEKIDGGSMTQYANDLDRAFISKWIEQGAEEN